MFETPANRAAWIAAQKKLDALLKATKGSGKYDQLVKTNKQDLENAYEIYVRRIVGTLYIPIEPFLYEEIAVADKIKAKIGIGFKDIRVPIAQPSISNTTRYNVITFFEMYRKGFDHWTNVQRYPRRVMPAPGSILSDPFEALFGKKQFRPHSGIDIGLGIGMIEVLIDLKVNTKSTAAQDTVKDSWVRFVPIIGWIVQLGSAAADGLVSSFGSFEHKNLKVTAQSNYELLLDFVEDGSHIRPKLRLALGMFLLKFSKKFPCNLHQKAIQPIRKKQLMEKIPKIIQKSLEQLGIDQFLRFPPAPLGFTSSSPRVFIEDYPMIGGLSSNRLPRVTFVTDVLQSKGPMDGILTAGSSRQELEALIYTSLKAGLQGQKNSKTRFVLGTLGCNTNLLSLLIANNSSDYIHSFSTKDSKILGKEFKKALVNLTELSDDDKYAVDSMVDRGLSFSLSAGTVPKVTPVWNVDGSTVGDRPRRFLLHFDDWRLNIGGRPERNLNETTCQVYAAGLKMYAEVVIGKKTGLGANGEPVLLPGILDRLFDFYVDESSVEVYLHEGHLATNRDFSIQGPFNYKLFESITSPSFRMRKIVLDALQPVFLLAFKMMLKAKKRTDTAIKGKNQDLGFWQNHTNWYDMRLHDSLRQKYLLTSQLNADQLGLESLFFLEEDRCVWNLSYNIVSIFNVPRFFLDNPKFEQLESFTPTP